MNDANEVQGSIYEHALNPVDLALGQKDLLGNIPQTWVWKDKYGCSRHTSHDVKFTLSRPTLQVAALQVKSHGPISELLRTPFVQDHAFIFGVDHLSQRPAYGMPQTSGDQQSSL